MDRWIDQLIDICEAKKKNIKNIPGNMRCSRNQYSHKTYHKKNKLHNHLIELYALFLLNPNGSYKTLLDIYCIVKKERQRILNFSFFEMKTIIKLLQYTILNRK